MYSIKPRQKRAAKRLGVSIKPSTDSKKKVDVFDKDNKKLASIGDINYNDYASYIKSNGLEYADNRKRLYKIRHEKTRKVVGSKSYYADQILWT
tara:strand:- start:1486 stop:1767 length:282 start_codon:yes stop_codon:yes gene_type:complete